MKTSSVVDAACTRGVRSLHARLRRFWSAPAGTVPHGPLAAAAGLTCALYRAGLDFDQRRSRSRRRRLPARVVSVGNLTVGGTGKTPFTMWLARHFKQEGRNVAVLSRGYGRSGSAPGRVPPAADPSALALEYGDEPALLALKLKDTPVYVGRRRWESGMAAIESARAEIIVLDDGFQHLALDRDLDLVLLDAANPFGNGFTLPLGPLREPPAHLARAHAIVLTRAGDPDAVARTRAWLADICPGKPVFSALHKPKGFTAGLGGHPIPLSDIAGRPAVAFAGIADPFSFFSQLESLGIVLRRTFAFPDHHRPSACETTALLDAVRASSAQFLITTEKDAVRLPLMLRSVVCVPELEIDFGADGTRFIEFLDREIGAGSH